MPKVEWDKMGFGATLVNTQFFVVEGLVQNWHSCGWALRNTLWLNCWVSDATCVLLKTNQTLNFWINCNKSPKWTQMNWIPAAAHLLQNCCYCCHEWCSSTSCATGSAFPELHCHNDSRLWCFSFMGETTSMISCQREVKTSAQEMRSDSVKFWCDVSVGPNSNAWLIHKNIELFLGLML